MGKKTRLKLEKAAALHKAQMMELKQKGMPKKPRKRSVPVSLPAVCAGYPQQRAIADFKCASYVADRRSAQLLKYLYCEYAVPIWLLDWLVKEDGIGLASATHGRSVAMLMSVVYEMGNGRFPKPILRPYLSKAEMSLFFRSGGPVNRQSTIFSHFVYCMALAKGLGEAVCAKIARLTAELRLDKQNVFCFVRSFVEFCAAREVNGISAQDIWDYLRCNQLIGRFSFKGRTLASMLNIVNSWHEALNREIRILQPYLHNGDWFSKQKRIEDLKIEYKFAPGISGHWDAFDRQAGWTIEVRQLRKYTELVNEGGAMHNCVAGYHQRCAQGLCSIFSLQIDGVRKATIEVSGKKVVQARGNCNRMLAGYPLYWLRKWMDKFKLVDAF